jgi:hypothetical protein
MIVIERDGKTSVIIGWRAWVIGAVAVAAMTAVLGALVFLVLGIAVSMCLGLGSKVASAATRCALWDGSPSGRRRVAAPCSCTTARPREARERR